MGFGVELEPFVSLGTLGGIVTKTITPKPRLGNPPPRIVETSSGLLNSIGIPNPGFEAFRRGILPRLRPLECRKIINIAGDSVDEFATLAEALDREEGIDAIELNLSCPNIHASCLPFVSDPAVTHEVVRRVRASTARPVWVKLSPGSDRILEAARAAEEAGAHALTVANTILGMAVDWRRRRPILGNDVGGLSGPAIKPITLRLVAEVARAVRLPLVGVGGIRTASDVLEYLVAGASAVQIGTWAYVDPTVFRSLAQELGRHLEEEEVGSVKDLVGTLRLHKEEDGGSEDP